MPWLRVARRAVLLVLVTLALTVSTTSASRTPGCSDQSAPQFAPSLLDLQAAIGGAMGSPASCPQSDPQGDIVQITTTGVAMVRPDGMALFASGENHWALSSQGLQTWTANWHNGIYPPVTAPAADDQPVAGAPAPATVQAMTVVQPRDASNAVVVQDAGGEMFTLQTGSGCPDLVVSPGDQIFVRSGGSQTDLVVLQQHLTCAVAEMDPAAAN